jgi:hypothetical protein
MEDNPPAPMPALAAFMSIPRFCQRKCQRNRRLDLSLLDQLSDGTQLIIGGSGGVFPCPNAVL